MNAAVGAAAAAYSYLTGQQPAPVVHTPYVLSFFRDIFDRGEPISFKNNAEMFGVALNTLRNFESEKSTYGYSTSYYATLRDLLADFRKKLKTPGWILEDFPFVFWFHFKTQQ